MANIRLRLASTAALAQATLAIWFVFVRFAMTGDVNNLRFSLSHPSVWLAFLLIVVGWGLWRRRAWAWWLGVGAAATQMALHGNWLFKNYRFFSRATPPDFVSLSAIVLTVILFVLLLFSKVRASCNR
jgi:uncharacterized membrane protein (DUF2068 family)